VLVPRPSNQSFNPLPAMKPGGTSQSCYDDAVQYKFQSAPGDEAGRNEDVAGLGSLR